MSRFGSELAKVKYLGSAKSGVKFWIWQRLTALFLIPLFVWFIYTLFDFFINPEYITNEVLYSPFALLIFVLLINLSLFHGMLGVKVILEDYIHSEFKKNLFIIFIYVITFVTISAVTFTLMLNFIVNI
jgi:succinate dehydrogenase / fumarate reductase membrane anchor subunit